MFALAMAIALCFYLTACGGNKSTNVKKPTSMGTGVIEVSPPTEIQRLGRLFDRFEPQVAIVSPKSDTILDNNQVTVKFDVKDLPIFKNVTFGLGPHIHVALDGQEYKALYDLNQSISFENLAPGTHTIRAFASRPWHESFKNEGAYAQTTFHVFTKTGENTPTPSLPLLTYSRPVGTYGAEPIMLDFYLKNAPLHLVALEDDSVPDWQIRATLNGQSFTFDQWQPIYLKGFKTGKNWVKLELLDGAGNLIPNTSNSSAHAIDYQPNGADTLARLMRGEAIANIESIVDPNYVPPAPPVPVVVPPVEPATAPSVAPKAIESEPKAEEVKPETKTEIKPEIKPEPKAEEVKPEPLIAPPVVIPPVVVPPSSDSKLKEPEAKKPEISPAKPAPTVPEVKPEAKSEVQDKVEPKTEPKAEPNVETKIEEKEVKTESKAKADPVVKPSANPTKKPSWSDRIRRKENSKAAELKKAPKKKEVTEAKPQPVKEESKQVPPADVKAKEAPVVKSSPSPSSSPTHKPTILERYSKQNGQTVQAKPHMAPMQQVRKPIPQFVPMQEKLKQQKQEMDKPAENVVPSLSGTSEPVKAR